MLPVYHDLLRMFCQDPVWAASCGREESRILRGRLRNEILQAAVEMSSVSVRQIVILFKYFKVLFFLVPKSAKNPMKTEKQQSVL